MWWRANSFGGLSSNVHSSTWASKAMTGCMMECQRVLRTDARLTCPYDPRMINLESELPCACRLVDGIIHGGNGEPFLRRPRSDISRVQWEINLEWRKELHCTESWFRLHEKGWLATKMKKH